MTIPRWLVVVVLLLMVLGMLFWARGIQHHRGGDVGALVPRTSAVSHGLDG